YRGHRSLYPLHGFGGLVDDRADHPRQWRLYDQVEHFQQKCGAVLRGIMRENDKTEHFQQKCGAVLRRIMRETMRWSISSDSIPTGNAPGSMAACRCRDRPPYGSLKIEEGLFGLQEFAHFQQDELIVIHLVERAACRERQIVVIADDDMRFVHAVHILDGQERHVVNALASTLTALVFRVGNGEQVDIADLAHVLADIAVVESDLVDA